MENSQTLRLLLIAATENKAEATLVLIKNAGFSVRPKLVTNAADLEVVIRDKIWDLCVYHEKVEKLTSVELVDTLSEQGKDIPVIVLSDSTDEKFSLPLIKAGINSICKYDEHDLLVELVRRKTDNLRERRKVKIREYELEEQKKQILMLLQSSREAIAYIKENKFLYANPAFSTLFAYKDPNELLKIPAAAIISTKEKSRFENSVLKIENGEISGCTFSCMGKYKDGNPVNIELTILKTMFKSLSCLQLLIRAKDDLHAHDKYIDELDKKDLITNLYNKQYFISMLNKQIALKMESVSSAFILYIEIDNFRQLKSEIGLGHSDLVISDIAENIRTTIDNNTITLARYAEDTFTLLVSSANKDDILKLANNINSSLSKHIQENIEKEYKLSHAIGICQLTDMAANSNDILAKAYSACSMAKENPTKLRFYVGEESLNKDEEKKIIIELEKALEEGKLNLNYQPIVGLHGEHKDYYEVLLRMRNEKGETILPEKFFPNYSNDQILKRIDRWVILNSTKVLLDQRLQGHNTFLFVKLSVQSILDTSLLPWISAIFKSARIPGDAMIFDLAEDDIATHLEQAQFFIKKLSELHSLCCINKFGRGINSYSTIKNLDAKFVKLDGSFSQAIYDKEKGAVEKLNKIVRTLHNDGRLVILPKVEHATIMPAVWKADVNYIQGYYLQSPDNELNYNFPEHLAKI